MKGDKDMFKPSTKEERKAVRLGCLLLIIAAIMALLAFYGAAQLVTNYIIPLL